MSPAPMDEACMECGRLIGKLTHPKFPDQLICVPCEMYVRGSILIEESQILWDKMTGTIRVKP